MSVTIEAILNLIGGNLRDEETRTRFREFLEEQISDEIVLKAFIDECIEKGGRGGREFNNALQDIIVSIGKKLSFHIEYGRYSGSQAHDVIGYDGLWRKDSGEAILLEVKSSPWPVNNISNQLGRYLDEYSEIHEVPSEQIFGLYVIGSGEYDAIVDQIKGSNYRNRIRLISSNDLIKLVKLVEDLNSIGGPGSGGPKVQNILLPFESVNVGDFIGLVMEIAELKETSSEIQEELVDDDKEEKIWEKENLLRYLEESTPYQKAFLTVLSLADNDEEPLPKNLVLQRMTRVATQISEISDDKEFTGYTIAGVRAGFKMRRDRDNMEDIIVEHHHNYRLKERYKNIVRDWIVSLNLSVPPLST